MTLFGQSSVRRPHHRMRRPVGTDGGDDTAGVPSSSSSSKRRRLDTLGGRGRGRKRGRGRLSDDGVTVHDDASDAFVVGDDAYVDFDALARGDARFAAFVKKDGKGRAMVDFTSWEATRALTGAILETRYGVGAWTLPAGHLVPPTTNRMRYLEWLARLEKVSTNVNESGEVRVLDVGTGASVIYPLLGASRFGWRFVGSDVSDEALTCARGNLERNPHLKDLVEIRDARDDQGRRRVLRGVVREGETFTFCMCNPPFFNSMDEAGLNPNTACGGTETEMVYPGGEETFIKEMFRDSLTMKDSIHWFTTMCGKKKTMTKLRTLFHATRVPAIRTTELAHGKTSRWCIAWSFSKDAASKANVPLPDPEKLEKVKRALEERAEG
jgi:23S rRNA (adenine1618-N6)-methyltransferase